MSRKTRQELLIEIKNLNPNIKNIDNLRKQELVELLYEERKAHFERLKAERDAQDAHSRMRSLDEHFGTSNPFIPSPAGDAHPILARAIQHLLAERTVLYTLAHQIKLVLHLHARFEHIRAAIGTCTPDGITITEEDVADAYFRLSDAITHLTPPEFNLEDIFSPVEQALSNRNLVVSVKQD